MAAVSSHQLSFCPRLLSHPWQNACESRRFFLYTTPTPMGTLFIHLFKYFSFHCFSPRSVIKEDKQLAVGGGVLKVSFISTSKWEINIFSCLLNLGTFLLLNLSLYSWMIPWTTGFSHIRFRPKKKRQPCASGRFVCSVSWVIVFQVCYVLCVARHAGSATQRLLSA